MPTAPMPSAVKRHDHSSSTSPAPSLQPIGHVGSDAHGWWLALLLSRLDWALYINRELCLFSQIHWILKQNSGPGLPSLAGAMAVMKQTTFCFPSDRCDGTPAELRPEWQQVTSSGWGGGQILLNKDVRPIFVHFSSPSICGNKPETGKQSASATTSFPFTVHQELLLYERKGWMWCQHKVIVILFEQVCGVLLKGECGWAAGSSQCRAVHALTRAHRVYCHNNRVWRRVSQRAAPIYPVRWTGAVLPCYLPPSWNRAWKKQAHWGLSEQPRCARSHRGGPAARAVPSPGFSQTALLPAWVEGEVAGGGSQLCSIGTVTPWCAPRTGDVMIHCKSCRGYRR